MIEQCERCGYEASVPADELYQGVCYACLLQRYDREIDEPEGPLVKRRGYIIDQIEESVTAAPSVEPLTVEQLRRAGGHNG